MTQIQTVLGSILPEELGTTLMHEHLIVSAFNKTFVGTEKSVQPSTSRDEVDFNEPVTMNILGLLRRNPILCKDNSIYSDESLAVKELNYFKEFGGKSIVEVTVKGIGRNPLALQRISKTSGLNIIAATGWYVAISHPDHVKNKTVEDLTAIMVKEIEEGIGTTGIKAGVIGEIGCSNPVPYHSEEKKVVRAAAGAQIETNAAYTIHPSLTDANKRINSVQCADKYVDLIEKEGMNLEKFYLSHADRTSMYLDYHRKLLDRGISLGYDCFGKFYYFDTIFIGAGGVTDGDRIKAIVELCKNGYDKQIILSHDCGFKTDLREYGGFGYAHISRNIIPMLEDKGVSHKQIRNMMIDNPMHLLAF